MRGSNDKRARNIEPVNNVWSSYFHANQFSALVHSETHGFCAREEGETKLRSPQKKEEEKKTGKKNPVQPEDDGLGVFPVPFVSQRSLSAGSTQTTAAEGASLGSIKCQTDHIDAAAVSSAVINIRTNPDSSQKSQWRGRRGRDARSIRALIGWEEPSVSSKESLFSSVSSPAGNEARCKKYPH